MDILNQIVLSFNKEDARHFKLIAKRMYDNEDRKDIQLFDYIRKSELQYDDNFIFKKLYKKGEKNAFYRLKNRLISDLNEAMLMLHYSKDEVMHIFHLLSITRFYFLRNKQELALRFLRKAEAEALKIESFELLDTIYGEYIKLSNDLMSVNPEEYINKRKTNQIQLNAIRDIDNILEAVIHRLKVTQNFAGAELSVTTLLEKTINDFSSDVQTKKSPKLRFKIYYAVSQLLLQQYNYVELERYLLKIYQEFTAEKLFNKNNHDAQLQMLTYIVNSLFKNKKFELSLQYAEKLRLGMEEFDAFLKEKYQVFYYNTLVINYSEIDKDKAIDILEKLKADKSIQGKSFYGIFIYLNLAILYFDKKEFKQAIRNITQLHLHDGYKKADTMLKFKISVAELIMRFEQADYDLLDHQLNQFKKDYKQLLNKQAHKRERDFISILKELMIAPTINTNKKLVKNITLFIADNSQEDSEIIKYNHWLKSKLK